LYFYRIYVVNDVEKELLLVLGGAKSGKSSWALRYTESSYRSYLFLATAEIRDEEMKERVKRHRQQRCVEWQLLEEPLEVAEALERKISGPEAVLIDCLTLWLTNVMLQKGEEQVGPSQGRLLNALDNRKQAIIIVSNEVGTGVVPEKALGRRFRDHAGELNQKVAAMADRVVYVVAGLPLYLKGPPS
jgi:adenosylcobinamide kinase/adenosylcobinamide-phosphate guanylyltransferase